MKKIIFVFLLVFINSVMSATYVVNYNGDDLSDPVADNGVCETALGNNQCTLRAAIESANESPGGPHTVEVPYLSGESYPIWAANGIDAYVPMTIRGTGAGRPVLVGELFVNGGMITIGDAITLENLEIRPNTTSGNATQGLTVLSSNLVSIEDVTIIPGSGGNNVGLIVNGGFLSCERCEIKDGQSLAVRVINDGRLRMLNSRITNNINSSGAQGAGIRLDEGDVTVIDSLIDNNQTIGFGGGVYTAQNNTFLHIVNSTISSNKANGDGGGIFAQGATLLENATITRNTADFDGINGGSGGGIYINDFSIITAKNTIIHGNFLTCPNGVPFCLPDGRNCDDSQNGTIGIESLGWVMVGNDANCPLTDLTGETNYISTAIPNLGPLTLLGGLHPVHPIIDEGQEADGGNPDGCTFTLITQNGSIDLPLNLDQRGMIRPLNSDTNPFDGASCDIGAYEATCFGDDPDGDFVGSDCDVCPDDFNPLQEDSNDDGIGDTCSGDLVFYNGFE